MGKMGMRRLPEKQWKIWRRIFGRRWSVRSGGREVFMKQKENCRIMKQERIARDVYSLWLETKAIAADAAPGQFVMLYGKDGSRLLPRPISICQAKGTALRLVYRTVGGGTREFSRLEAGQFLEAMGPLGQGFPVEKAQGKKVLLLGGGIGIPPMLETAARLKGDVTAVLGYKDEVFLKDDFERFCPVIYAIEDGAAQANGAVEGNVLDAVREQRVQADVIFACGPVLMLRAIKAYAQGLDIPCWISMEERMACGIGACLGCVCDAAQEDAHLRVCRKRVCKDGPVFLSTEVEL